jgi:hypothetical protein
VEEMWTEVHSLWICLWKAWTGLWGTRPMVPQSAR